MDLTELTTDRQNLERVIESELEGFRQKWPGLRVTLIHEWIDLRRVGDQPARQEAHSIRVEVSL